MAVLQLPADWADALDGSPALERLPALGAALEQERRAGAVYPPAGAELAALALTPFEQVRVVILGQDPYHGPGQAMGLAFSVPAGVPVPPSLRNVQAEIESDLGIARAGHGDLSAWARRGVLLLNTTLSVRAGRAGSHRRLGWEQLSAALIGALSARRRDLVFLLWGRHAQRAGEGVDRHRHLVLEAAHPSPLSARHGFAGCRHFSKANAHLERRGVPAIDWSLPPLS